MASERAERGAFAVVTAIAAVIVGAQPVLPGHDMPQHLAYLRLLVAHATGSLADAYTAPDLSSAYATLYALLVPIARWTSPETAVRIVLVAYVVLLAVAVRALVRATWGRAPAPATSLLGPVVALNPVVCMGFLAYTLALAPLVGAIAAAVDWAAHGRRRSLAVLAVLAALTGLIHGVAGAALVFFLALVAAARRDRRAIAAFGVAFVGVALAVRSAGASASFPSGFGATLVHNMREFGPVSGALGSFGVSFTGAGEKVGQILASLLGPFPRREKIVCGVVLVVGAVVARGEPMTSDETTRVSVRGVRAAILVFAVSAVLAPAALQIPDDLSFLDFRLITTATILGVAALPPHRIACSVRGALAVAGAAGLVLAIWARQLSGTAGELGQTLHLVERLEPTDRLLALPLDDSSAFLDDANDVLHYAAVLHTARSGGVTSSFWARFSPRLPVGYRPGREPAHPPDRAPWEFEPSQLAEYSHVLVRWPVADAEDEVHDAALRLWALHRAGRLRTVACEGTSCLFAVTTDVVAR
jgi:hypothetical protein